MIRDWSELKSDYECAKNWLLFNFRKNFKNDKSDFDFQQSGQAENDEILSTIQWIRATGNDRGTLFEFYFLIRLEPNRKCNKKKTIEKIK